MSLGKRVSLQVNGRFKTKCPSSVYCGFSFFSGGFLSAVQEDVRAHMWIYITLLKLTIYHKSLFLQCHV